jgi:hypothetical protein
MSGWMRSARARAVRVLMGAALAALVSSVAAGCGESGTNSQDASTVTQTVTSESSGAAPTDNGGSDSTDSNGGDSSGGGSSGDIAVPDVVGKDHQLAQDTMQSAGLYNLSEEDATGQGRMLIYDRNWVVVSQDPPAGTQVSEDQTITLRSKKKTDP